MSHGNISAAHYADGWRRASAPISPAGSGSVETQQMYSHPPLAARYRGAEGAGPLRALDCAALWQKESERREAEIVEALMQS
ncbi:hypothetical protein CRENBAI_012433 [Crenichthys baileyi]|uniref:Uncharacterized protein n=1 Tax=Crenichthys baileyi TaxID=28760 RepID=A0AAV9SE75_9TELE